MREIRSKAGHVFLVDEDDFNLVSRYTWHEDKGYARTTVINYSRSNPQTGPRCTAIMMHHLLMGKPPRGFNVDHINRNRADNRRCNLRVVTASQNARNRTWKNRHGYRGVSLDDRWRPRYMAWIQDPVTRKSRFLGSFRHPEEAALAYDQAARERDGAFAICNYPDES